MGTCTCNHMPVLKGPATPYKKSLGEDFLLSFNTIWKTLSMKTGVHFLIGDFVCDPLSREARTGGDHDGQNLFSRPKSFCMILLHCLLNAKLLFKCLRNNNCFVILVSTVAFMSKLSLVQLKRY